MASMTDPYGSILGFLDRNRYFLFQVAPQLYSRGWVDPVPDPWLLRKSGNQTPILQSSSPRPNHCTEWVIFPLEWYSHNTSIYLSFIFPKTQHTKSTIFWNMMSCSPLKVNWCFGGAYHLHLCGWITSETRYQHDRWQTGLCHVLPKLQLAFNGLYRIISQKIGTSIHITHNISNSFPTLPTPNFVYLVGFLCSYTTSPF
jgi:hypothetical protein